MCVSDDTLMNDSSGNELIVTFKGFDFLDNELNEESEVGCSPLAHCFACVIGNVYIFVVFIRLHMIISCVLCHGFVLNFDLVICRFLIPFYIYLCCHHFSGNLFYDRLGNAANYVYVLFCTLTVVLNMCGIFLSIHLCIL